MKATDQCPFCGSSKIVHGLIQAPQASGFKPDETKSGFFWSLRSPVCIKFDLPACYCGSCGMVWAKADERDAAYFMEHYATDKLKVMLAQPDPTPAPNLDVPPHQPGAV
jgi:hypothetical protein